MEISSSYSSQTTNLNNTHDTATEAHRRTDRQAPPDTSAEKFTGEQLKGRILDVSANESPPVVTVKLLSGETVKARAELPEGMKNGDYVKFIVQSGEDGQPVMSGMSRIDPKTATDPRLAFMSSALESAGLKADEANLKLVSMLMKNELPINKETIQAFSKMVRFAGAESAQKGVLLMNNDMPLTIGTLEKLNAHMNDGGKLLNQIQELAKNIMEMENGPEKQRLLQVFSETVSNASQNGAETASGKPSPAQTGQAAGQTAQAGQAGQLTQASEQTGQTAQAAPADAQARAQAAVQAGAQSGTNESAQIPQTAQSAAQATQAGAETSLQAQQAAQSSPSEVFPDTGTKFFRDVFGEKQAAQSHLTQNPPSPETAKFIEQNIEQLKNGFAELSQNGAVTKESIANLAKSAAEQTGTQIPFNAENDAELKSFVLSLAQKSGMFDESIEKAGHFERAVKNGAKKIAERLSVSIDNDKAEIEKAVENIKERLSLAASGLGEGKDADKVRQGIEEIKESLKFLNNFKNNTFMQIPIMLDGQQKQAELYVFPRKGGKKKDSRSQSALVSLDLANLGHFETYVQKTEKSVVCQFRLESEGVEELVRENIEKLNNALKEKRYSLDGIIFKKIDEKFNAADDEPEIGEVVNPSDKSGKFSFDYKT